MNKTIEIIIVILLMITAAISILHNASAISTNALQTKKANVAQADSSVKPYVITGKPIVVTSVNTGDSSLFNGQGFAISQDETQGQLISLLLLSNNNVLTGKLNYANSNYKIEGQTQNNHVSFNAYDIKANENENALVGMFDGQILTFNNFRVLRGNLKLLDSTSLSATNWQLTLFSKQDNNKIKTVQPIAKEMAIENVKSMQPIAITSASNNVNSDTKNEQPIVITPTQIIKRPNIFGLAIPFTKEKVKLQILDKDGQLSEKTVAENSNAEVNGYKVSIGSLTDPDNIEISVQKTIAT